MGAGVTFGRLARLSAPVAWLHSVVCIQMSQLSFPNLPINISNYPSQMIRGLNPRASLLINQTTVVSWSCERHLFFFFSSATCIDLSCVFLKACFSNRGGKKQLSPLVLQLGIVLKRLLSAVASYVNGDGGMAFLSMEKLQLIKRKKKWSWGCLWSQLLVSFYALNILCIFSFVWLEQRSKGTSLDQWASCFMFLFCAKWHRLFLKPHFVTSWLFHPNSCERIQRHCPVFIIFYN